jgi:hypothetical protein
MLYIASTRFNTETLESNYKYRADKKIQGCIYGSCMMINEKYPINSLLFVIEMNNTQNKIEGIGLIKNRLVLDKYYKIYEDGHYNRYTYGGKYWVSREQIIEYNLELVEIFDKILFKGKSNVKRISGISVVTEKLFKRWEYDVYVITRQVNQMFTDIFKKDGIEKVLEF